MRNRSIIPISPILAGLVTAQILGFIHVYLSNIELYYSLTIIKESGYLIVPNSVILPTLMEFVSAFWGGLFFTLTVGATLTLITLAAIWIWINILRKNRYALIPFFLIWLACLAGTNAKGFSPMAAAYFLIIPFIVIVSATRWLASENGKKSRLKAVILLAPLIVLSILWSTLLKQNPLNQNPLTNISINIRDYFLLSNPAGIMINDFYYKYNRYAAFAFTPLNMKTLKTCRLLNLENNSDEQSLKNRLLNRDYLVLDTGRVDLVIDKQGDELVFMYKGREVFRTEQKLFLSEPGTYLKSFSDQTDRYDFFRGFTYLSILIGFPVLLYLLVHVVLQFILYFFRDPTSRLTVSSITCLLIGIAFFVPVHKGSAVNIEKQDIDVLMRSARWQDQSAALRMIYQEKLELADYPAYLDMKGSPYIPVRYWLAKAAGVSKKKETYNDVIALLNDSHPNVLCQALEALGKRGDKKAVELIKQKIKESDHWHVQVYAYIAMRDLGWKQRKSILNN